MRTALAVACLLSANARAAAPTLEPPPGWSDAAKQAKMNAVIVLKGPEQSSFIVKRAPTAPIDNPAGVRNYLNDVLVGLRDASKKDYRGSNRVQTQVFRNGLTANLLRARLDDEDRLVLALFNAGGVPHLAVLLSHAPEAMLPHLLGAIHLGKVEGAIQASGIVRSLDGQLEMSLGGGLRSRALLDAEVAKGFTLAVQGAGSEILFLKIAESEATKPGEQAAIVREMAAASAGVGAAKAAPVKSVPTAAGPVGVYSWAPLPAGEKLSVGYLPWSYWGYQLFGRGPSADDLLVGVLAALKAGPSAVPGLLASTPAIPIETEIPRRRIMQGGVAAAVLVLMIVVWSLKKR